MGHQTFSMNFAFSARRFSRLRENIRNSASRVMIPATVPMMLYASGIFSENTGKTYDAYIVLEDDGTKTAYRLEFERGKTNGKQYS